VCSFNIDDDDLPSGMEVTTEIKREMEMETIATTEMETPVLNKTIPNCQRETTSTEYETPGAVRERQQALNMKRQVLAFICFQFSSSQEMNRMNKRKKKNKRQYGSEY